MSLLSSYHDLQHQVRHGVWTDGVRAALVKVVNESISFLATAAAIPENSFVPQKSYVAFRVGDITSRVVNSRLYDAELCLDRIDHVLRKGPDTISPYEASRVLYTAAMSFVAPTTSNQVIERAAEVANSSNFSSATWLQLPWGCADSLN